MNINVLYQVERSLPARLSGDSQRHSQLAMRAARGMARTRRKSQHGRVVCHHLLRMLASDAEPAHGTPPVSGQAGGPQAGCAAPRPGEQFALGL